MSIGFGAEASSFFFISYLFVEPGAEDVSRGIDQIFHLVSGSPSTSQSLNSFIDRDPRRFLQRVSNQPTTFKGRDPAKTFQVGATYQVRHPHPKFLLLRNQVLQIGLIRFTALSPLQ